MLYIILHKKGRRSTAKIDVLPVNSLVLVAGWWRVKMHENLSSKT